MFSVEDEVQRDMTDEDGLGILRFSCIFLLSPIAVSLIMELYLSKY